MACHQSHQRLNPKSLATAKLTVLFKLKARRWSLLPKNLSALLADERLLHWFTQNYDATDCLEGPNFSCIQKHRSCYSRYVCICTPLGKSLQVSLGCFVLPDLKVGEKTL